MTKYTKQEAAAARNLLRVYKRYGWCKNYYAKNKQGVPVGTRNPDAVCFCLSGATDKADELMGLDAPQVTHEDRLNSALRKRHIYSIISYNDFQAKSKEQVLDLLREIGGLK